MPNLIPESKSTFQDLSPLSRPSRLVEPHYASFALEWLEVKAGRLEQLVVYPTPPQRPFSTFPSPPAAANVFCLVWQLRASFYLFIYFTLCRICEYICLPVCGCVCQCVCVCVALCVRHFYNFLVWYFVLFWCAEIKQIFVAYFKAAAAVAPLKWYFS